MLAKALEIHDRNNKRLKVRALGWGLALLGDEQKEGVILTLYSHRMDGDDFIQPGEFGKNGRSDLSLIHYTPCEFGDRLILTEHSNVEMIRILQTFWRLARQEIVVPGHFPLQRATWRRSFNREIKTTIVFTLRRTRSPKLDEANGNGREYSHRWMVRGHWRNQPYKMSGSVVHRQIWISDYVKGPDGKPLVLKKRVYDFRR